MKNSGLLLNMAKWCFGFFFEFLLLLWFVFGVFGMVPEVLKILVFCQFWGLLWGGLFFFTFGLEGLDGFVFLVFVFVFCVAFVSVLFALFLFCWIVFGVGSCFALVFVLFFCLLFVFVFDFVLEGLRVR